MPKIVFFLERHYKPLLASEFWEGRVHRSKVSGKSISARGDKEGVNSQAKSEFTESYKRRVILLYCNVLLDGKGASCPRGGAWQVIVIKLI
jgi:hypothetical protein